MDSSGLADEYHVVQTLDNRFGVATEQSLINAYRSAWIQTTDLDNIKNAGYNCVRVPVWWGDFFTLSSYGSSSGWRSDAFTYLDWLVSNCASRGIYVIIDMHGAVGGQSNDVVTGYGSQDQYWNNGTYQGDTAWMWWQIANHFKGNATVAGYDLLNEPTGAPSPQAVWTAYNNLYGSVRSADPDHMIIMEGFFNTYDWDALPSPSTYGWTNIMYEMHEYQKNDLQTVENGSLNQANDFNNHASWNIPGYIGEFNDYSNGQACWNYSIGVYNQNNLNWTVWAYKTNRGINDSWGWYDRSSSTPIPNIQTDTAATIQSDWSQAYTANGWVQNTTTVGNNVGSGAPVGHVISIVSQANSDYVCADNYGADPLIANRTSASSWEEFRVIDEGGGIVALQALANNEYVCADNAGSSPLIANRTSVGAWEEFRWVSLGGNTFGLQAVANGDYVCADENLANPPQLIANRTSIGGAWESFNYNIVQ
jgi:aryl-phospho-beta-D-glucosidase BglC (GH1 family)